MNQFSTIPDTTIIEKTAKALEGNGITTLTVETKEQAKEKVLSLIPDNAEVMDMTSVTLTETSIQESINQSGDYSSVKATLSKLNRETDNRQMQQLGAAPEYAVGSVHAVTEDGTVLIASNTGSQLPAYAYGADHVIWVVGAQKIVKNIDEGMSRIYDYVLPLESQRAKEAYGMERSNVSKILIISKEITPKRITLIFVKEKLGF